MTTVPSAPPSATHAAAAAHARTPTHTTPAPDGPFASLLAELFTDPSLDNADPADPIANADPSADGLTANGDSTHPRRPRRSAAADGDDPLALTVSNLAFAPGPSGDSPALGADSGSARGLDAALADGGLPLDAGGEPLAAEASVAVGNGDMQAAEVGTAQDAQAPAVIASSLNATAPGVQTVTESPLSASTGTLARSKSRMAALGRTAATPDRDTRTPLALNSTRPETTAGTAERAAAAADALAALQPAAMATATATAPEAPPTTPRELAPSQAPHASAHPTLASTAQHGSASAQGDNPAADATASAAPPLATTADPFDTLGSQISLWAAGKTQRAHVSVDEGLAQPLAVDLSLADGVAHLALRTDDAALRQQLAQAPAQSALADALARAGIALGAMDVDSHGPSGRDQPAADSAPRSARAVSGVNAGRDSETPRVVRTRIGPGAGSGLDVYA
jgi:hypothetical protein